MSSTGVREPLNDRKRTIKGLIQNEAQFIQSLRVFANTSTLSGLGSTGGEINNAPSARGTPFQKNGDTMIGQYGDDFTIIDIDNGTLNVSQVDGVTSPLIVLNPETIPDDLDTIFTGEQPFSFQRLRIRTTNDDIIFTENGNIITPQGGDFVVPPDSIVELVFDGIIPFLKWKIISATNGINSAVRTVSVEPTTIAEADTAFGKTVGTLGVSDNGSNKLKMFIKQIDGSWSSSDFKYNELTS